MGNWEEALNTYCEIYYQSGKKFDWIVVGSVGSVLQGAVMEPNDIDIYTKDVQGIEAISNLLSHFQLERKSELSQNDSNWLSSIEEPYFTQTFDSGFTWTKGRWKINSFYLEAVCISNSAGIPDSELGGGIWEGGKFIWELARYVNFIEHTVPVVPLEIQLESNLRRKRQDRRDTIVTALNTFGHDQELLNKALSTANLEWWTTECLPISKD